MEGLTLISSHSKDDIQSIGLVFEPNFFTAYFYADLTAEKLVAYQILDSTVSLLSHEIKSLKPLFALSFLGEYTLIPQQAFEEAEAGKYLEFNTSASANSAEWERIIGFDTVLIYKRDDKSERTVDTIYPGLGLKHGIGSLLEFCRQSLSDGNQVFLNQSGDIFDLVIFNGTELLLANSITTSHAEDVRYYLLYSLKQLGMDGDIFITFLGSAVKNQSIISLLKSYLIVLNKPNTELRIHDKLQFSTTSNPQLTATNWPGIYASLCAL